jgi:hypothetical protein
MELSCFSRIQKAFEFDFASQDFDAQEFASMISSLCS